MIDLLATILLSGTLLQAGGPQSIPIQNASFEAPVTMTYSDPANCVVAEETNQVPGWTVTQIDGGGSGIVQWCRPLPDGTQAIFLQGATASQALPFLPQAGTYILTVFIANWFYHYPGTYTVSLLDGGKTLCSTSGYGPDDFTEIALTCPVPGTIPIDHGMGFDPPSNLTISLSHTAWWPLLFDNVSLTFTPTD